jgi:NhaP-type Na+/H+ or K+/H+ antiporter
MPDPLIAYGIVALIFLLAGLVSGVVARAPISFPMLFLAIGFLTGERGLGLITIGPHNTTLEVIATLNLALVLFLDALNFRVGEIRESWVVATLSMGPGTLLTMLLIALAAHFLLRLAILPSLLIGAVLSSVDPVLLRDVLSDERVPRSIRDSLKIEAAASDIIVLPVLLVLAAIALGKTGTTASWLVFLVRLLIVGPLAGVVVGALASKLMEWARQRTEISQEYRALYGIGVLLAAYYAGARLGDSGFLAVFAAGLAAVLLNYDLCDCFLQYGEVTTEIVMLLAFLLFGALLSSIIGLARLLPALLFALVTLFLARPIALGVVLQNAVISRHARLFIGWFGPRGLSSLLFGLLLVSSGVPGSERLLAVVGIVVLLSVVLHGISALPLSAHYGRLVERKTYPEERESRAAGLFARDPSDVPRITPQELEILLSSDDPPIVLDVRSRSTYDRDAGQIPGSLRVLPDAVIDWAEGKPKIRTIVTYCT